MNARFRPLLLIVTVFWMYVALSDVLYADQMRFIFTSLHVGHLFAPWSARLLQHLFLYPVLLGCVWASLRLGWQPLWRRLPLQALLAVTFAALAEPTLWLGDAVLEGANFVVRQLVEAPGSPHGPMAPLTQIWIASATGFLLTYGFGLALATGFDVYRRLRDSQIRSAALERALTAAHLAALRMQLSPHSLFNLLNTIHGQIDGDPADARSMIVQLADLLRRLLCAGEREFSRLADELQFARLYLTLQQRRFADRLTVHVPDPNLAPEAWVPSLILQPLIENAVVHGLGGHSDAVQVRLEALTDGRMLTLRVSNTVAGAEPPGRAGIGLKNVRERLAIQFGDRATFEAAERFAGLWVTEIRLPLLAQLNDPSVATPAAA